jgi:hypothetical protein
MSTVNPELLVAELDDGLAECLRRAANRAEHIRLVRLQGLVTELKQQLGGPGGTSSGETSTDA